MKLKQDVFIGINLQYWRIKKRYSQEALAEKLRDDGYEYVSRDIIAKMEAGKYNIRVGLLMRLKELYEIPYEQFFRTDITSEDINKLKKEKSETKK